MGQLPHPSPPRRLDAFALYKIPLDPFLFGGKVEKDL